MAIAFVEFRARGLQNKIYFYLKMNRVKGTILIIKEITYAKVC